MHTHPCSECGAPIANPRAGVCSVSCRSKRHREGRAVPRAEYVAKLCGSRLPVYHEPAPKGPPKGSALAALAQRVAALEAASTTTRYPTARDALAALGVEVPAHATEDRLRRAMPDGYRLVQTRTLERGGVAVTWHTVRADGG